jgi:hypothetical protein
MASVAQAILLYSILRSLNLFHQLCAVRPQPSCMRYFMLLFICDCTAIEEVCSSHQPETLVTTALSMLLTLLSILMDVPVKVGVGTFYHILATILNLSSLMLEMR